MNGYLEAAVVVTCVIVAVHSIAGEIVILRRTDRAELTPFVKRTLRGAWHITSALGIGVIVVLLHDPDARMLDTFALVYVTCGVIAAVMTRFRHPAWAAFWTGAALLHLAA
jgi:hypothetical protein